MSSGNPSSNGAIDKDALYGNFLGWHKQQQEIYNDAVRMALDLPDRVPGVQANKVNFFNAPPVPGIPNGKSGGLAKLAMGAALVTGLGGLGLGAMALMKDPIVQEVEKLVPGENTEMRIEPGGMIFE